MDSGATLQDLKEMAIRFRDERNWEQFHNPKDLATGLSIESGELLELFLWKTRSEVDVFLASAGGHERLAEEMADVLVYLLYLSQGCGVDLSDAVERKLEKNAAKYPVDKSYGRHAKYTDLSGA